LLVHLLARLTILLARGGTRAVLAENILLKQQLLVLQRSRRQAPNLRTADRLLFGSCSQFLSPRRLIRTAIILKPVMPTSTTSCGAAQPSEQGHLAAHAQGLEANLRSQEPAAQSQRLNPTDARLSAVSPFARPVQLPDAPRAPHGSAGRLRLNGNSPCTGYGKFGDGWS
jgi:hypothetical protein